MLPCNHDQLVLCSKMELVFPYYMCCVIVWIHFVNTRLVRDACIQLASRRLPQLELCFRYGDLSLPARPSLLSLGFLQTPCCTVPPTQTPKALEFNRRVAYTFIFGILYCLHCREVLIFIDRFTLASIYAWIRYKSWDNVTPCVLLSSKNH